MELEITKEDLYAKLDVDEIDQLLDEEDDDHLTLEKYRMQRLEEMKKQAVKNRYGEVTEIVKDEWIREVTDGSKACIVLVHLYVDELVECQLMDEAFRNLSARFKYLKFLRIKYNQAIENWPEKNLPTVFIYDQGTLRSQIVTLNSLGGKSFTAAGIYLSPSISFSSHIFIFICLKIDLEWFLVKQRIITDSVLDEDPRSSDRKTITKGTMAASRFRSYDSDNDSDS